MDLRDEVAGTDGTIWVNTYLRTGFEMFTAGGSGGYTAEKSEADRGWMFPVGDDVVELGYTDMFTDMFDALDAGRPPSETFYDGYVVNAVMDACFKSATKRSWQPVELADWRGGQTPRIGSNRQPEMVDGKVVIKRELLPDGRHKLVLKDVKSGDYSDVVTSAPKS
jgi:hypothetical protein